MDEKESFVAEKGQIDRTIGYVRALPTIFIVHQYKL